MSTPFEDPDVEWDLTPESTLPAAIVDTDLTADPYYVPAWTKSAESIYKQEILGTSRPIRRPGLEPRESEFSWGRGRMAPLDKADPSQWDQVRAVYRTDPADPTSTVNYDGEVRE